MAAAGRIDDAVGISGSSGSARRPSMAIDSAGEPIVAWTDFSTGGSAIKVAAYDASTSTWIAVGNSLGSGGISGVGVSDDAHIVVTSSGPVVAWIDGTGGTVQVRALEFTGSSWRPLGGGLNDAVGSDADARDLTLATDGTQVAIAWAHGAGAVRVLGSSGGTWAPIGGDGLGGLGGSNASQPTLAYHGGILFAAWVASDGLRSQVYAAEFSGAVWSPAGAGSAAGSGVSNSTVGAVDPVLAASSGGLVLGWTDVWNTAATTQSVVYVKSWNGTSFVENVAGDAQEGGISATSAAAQTLALAVNPAGQPFVAWGQGASASPTVYVVGNTFKANRVFYVNGGGSAGIYTTAAGSDSNSGLTPSKPLASIQGLMDDYALQPGDLVLIDPGVYDTPATFASLATDVTVIGAPGVERRSNSAAPAYRRAESPCKTSLFRVA